jgi:hypothetical protein
MVPKGVPAEVTQTLDMVWENVISKSEAIKAYATKNGAIFAAPHGEKAVEAVTPAIRVTAWQLHAAGKSKVAPDTVGIAKP